MSRIKSLKKEQIAVRKVLRELNKSLKEDCFAGRFEVRQTNRICHNNYNGWCFETGITQDGTVGVAGHGYPIWYTAVYEIEFIDKENPERNFKKWFNKHESLNGMFNGSASIVGTMNDFIINSDFWEKWKNLEYKKTHWFSGNELKERIETAGEYYRTPEEFDEHLKKTNN